MTPSADFLPMADLAVLQAQAWRRQREYVSASAFYRAGGVPVPDSLEALAEYPTTDKEVLRSDQAAHPPFGSYLAAPAEQVNRLHRTSGTTGKAMNLALSARDAAMAQGVGARAQAACGLRRGRRIVHCLNFQLWMGGLTDCLTLEATGATVIPFGVGDTERLLQTIREIGVDAIYCTPSYPRRMEQVLADAWPGLQPRDLGLRLGLFAGEAGLDDPQFRARLEDTWGLAARNAGYGVSDVLTVIGGQCEAQTDLHFVAGDVLYAELLEPESGARLDWREGAEGELTLTHLDKECQPLVRFRTGDIVRLTATERCACGRTAPRFRVIGRSDDMVVVRGLNVFPSMVEGAIHGMAELSGAYRIVLRGPGPYDRLPLQAEVADGRFLSDDTAARLAERIKHDVGATADVELLAPGSLPATGGKTKRVVRDD